MHLHKAGKKLDLPDLETYIGKQFDSGPVAEIKFKAHAQFLEEHFHDDPDHFCNCLKEILDRRGWRQIERGDYDAVVKISKRNH